MKRTVLSIGLVLLLLSVQVCVGAPATEAAAAGAPSALKLVIVPNGFKLTWQPSPQDPGAVTGFEIVRSASASGPFTAVATVDTGVSEYTDTTAAPEIIYYYKVRAVAGSAYSPYSNTATGER